LNQVFSEQPRPGPGVKSWEKAERKKTNGWAGPRKSKRRTGSFRSKVENMLWTGTKNDSQHLGDEKGKRKHYSPLRRFESFEDTRGISGGERKKKNLPRGGLVKSKEFWRGGSLERIPPGAALRLGLPWQQQKKMKVQKKADKDKRKKLINLNKERSKNKKKRKKKQKKKKKKQKTNKKKKKKKNTQKRKGRREGRRKKKHKKKKKKKKKKKRKRKEEKTNKKQKKTKKKKENKHYERLSIKLNR